MIETWKQVSANYSVSTLGQVRNDKTGRLLRPVLMSNGYRAVKIPYKGKVLMHTVHRLVAENFLPVDPARLHVNHIDGDKQNNRLENLEWCTQAENNMHAFRSGLNKSTLTSVERMNSATRKPVEQLCLRTGDVLARFPSCMEARRVTGITSIHDCISGRQSTAGGYGWRYQRDFGEAA